jgi:hypothetical protein
MKLIVFLLLLAALAISYLAGYNQGMDRGVEITLKIDPRCKN